MAKRAALVRVAAEEEPDRSLEAGRRGAELMEPYAVAVTVEGVAPMLFHRADADEMTAKGAAAKNSRTKKTDNTESYLYRDRKSGEIGVPGMNIKAALAHSARSSSDPRSPRKSARELVIAGIFVTPPLVSLGLEEPDYIDRRTVLIQRNRIVRERPAVGEGWKLKFQINVIEAQLISEGFLRDIADRAGSLVGLCDFRPEFGRFRIMSWQRMNGEARG